MADAGIIVLCSFISPYASDREKVRILHAAADIPFIEVYVDCPLEEAESRDPKGLYKKARAGEIRHFTGIDDPYEVPTSPDVHVRSNEMSVAEELVTIMRALEDRQILTV